MENSKIISLKDTITITLDNRSNPPAVNVQCSRELPFVAIVALLSQALTMLAMHTAQQVAAAPLPPELSKSS